MSVLPSPAQLSKHSFHPNLLPPLLSLLLIIILLHPSSPSQSLFIAHESPSTYARPRNYNTYPWGKVCSPSANHHFLSRFNRPHIPLGAARKPKTLQQSQNRVFLSSIPHQVGDGLGHRTCILNYELHLSMVLGLTYSHRISSYGSITRHNPHAVENLFGWANGEITRDHILQKACAQVTYPNDTCDIPNPNIVCSRVRTRAKGGLFDQIVVIPDSLAECFLQRGPQQRFLDQTCFPLVQTFLAAYSEPNTLFQMRPNLCFHEYLYTNFSETALWFSEKYWSRRFVTSNSTYDQQSNSTQVTQVRQLSLDPSRIHIALHIRRGDFFNYTNRVLIPDSTYVDIVGRIKVALDEMLDANVPITAHIFSEGVTAAKQRLKDNHDISSMDKVYVNELGKRMAPNHWHTIIPKSKRLQSTYGVGRGWQRPDINVQVHIASDTVQALHDMIAADFFVGSISGLSMQVVRNIGRGLTILPVHESEILEDEFLVAFDYARNNVASFLNESLLYEKVAHYARKSRLACSVW